MYDSLYAILNKSENATLQYFILCEKVLVCLFVCLFALRPKSTAMVMAGRSVHLTTLFLGKFEQAVNQYFLHILSLVTDNNSS